MLTPRRVGLTTCSMLTMLWAGIASLCFTGSARAATIELLPLSGIAAVSADLETFVGGETQAFSWSLASGFNFWPSGFSRGLGISNDASHAVGVSIDSGFVTPLPAAAPTTLPHFMPGGSARALDVTDDGSLVVGSEDGVPLAWLAGIAIPLGPLSGSVASCSQCEARAVTPDGAVIVGTAASSGTTGEAFRTIAFVTSGLGTLPATSPGSTSAGVSDDGQVIVGWSATDAGDRAVRWVGGMIESLPLGAERALAVSPNGTWIVGEGEKGPFLWNAADGLRWIVDLLGQQGLQSCPQDFESGMALAVSNDATVIAGGTSGGHQWRVTLTPDPQPAPDSFDACGSLAARYEEIELSLPVAANSAGSVIVGGAGRSFCGIFGCLSSFVAERIGPNDPFHASEWAELLARSVAHGVSENGAYMVGERETLDGVFPVSENPFDPNETFTTLPGGVGAAYGVSDDRRVIVGTIGSPVPLAARWVDEGSPEIIGAGTAWAVSPDGSVTVGEAGGQAFSWEDGVLSVLPPLAGGTTSVARDLSASAAVIVGQSDSGSGPRAVRWIAGAALELDPEAELALGVSPNGQWIVGEGSNGAFIWSESTGLEWIYQRLLAEAANPVPDDLAAAFSVSDDGTVVVGRLGSGNAFRARFQTDPPGVATLPQPTAMIALALACVAAGAKGLAARQRLGRA